MIGVFSSCRSVRLLLAFIFAFLLLWSLGFVCLSKASGQSSDLGEPTPTETETSTEGSPSETPIGEPSGSVPTPEISATPTFLSETPTASSTDEPPTLPTATDTPTFEEKTESPTSAVDSETPTITTSPTSNSASLARNISSSFFADEVVIRLSSSASLADVKPCLDEIDGRVDAEIKELNVLVLKVPAGTVLESIARLSVCPGVDYAEPNYIARIADTIPSDPGFVNQYGLISIRAPQGWDLSTGSVSVVIAIVDTGVDLSHPDLASKIVSGYDFVNGDPFADDDNVLDNGHGTQVAGIAAAASNNGIGIAGVSWGALIMPVKVLDASGSGSDTTVAAGITWAADHGAQIINLSLGVPAYSATLENAVNYAYSRGAVLVAPTGNSGAGSILYPARYAHVIAVGGVDSSNNHWISSNYGPEVSVVAPAVHIYTTTLGGYAYEDGTSMAVPYVSGLAAILRGFSGNGSPDAITWEIESTALDLGLPGKDDLYGYGLIQMDRAIRLARPHRAATATNTPALFYLSFATSTFTPTWTATITSYQTTTPAAITQTETSTAGVSGFANFTPTSTPSGGAPKSTIPWAVCTGFLLLGVGMWLFWIAIRKAKGEHRRKYTVKKHDLIQQ
jgi:subtilisin family serine protease